METTKAENELAVIRKIMEDSRRMVVFDGKDYIVWGILVLIGLVGTYFIAMTGTPMREWWLWAGVAAAGWIYSITSHRKKASPNRVRTLAGKILSGVWLAFGITTMLIFVAAYTTGLIKGVALSPIIAANLGFANFVSGIIFGHAWARSLAYGWWLGAIVMFAFPGLHTLLVFAVLMVSLQIIPGIIFYNRCKRELSALAA